MINFLITNYLHLGENPFQFGPVLTENSDFCKVPYVCSPIPTSFDRRETQRSMNNSTPLSNCLKTESPSDKRWKKGFHDVLYKNPYFFRTT